MSQEAYDRDLAAAAAPTTKGQRQEGYDVNLLNDTTPAVAAPNRRQVDPERDAVNTEKYESPATTTAASLPWWRTRKGLIALVILAIIVVAAVVGGAVGGTRGKHSNATNPTNPSAPSSTTSDLTQRSSATSGFPTDKSSASAASVPAGADSTTTTTSSASQNQGQGQGQGRKRNDVVVLQLVGPLTARPAIVTQH